MHFSNESPQFPRTLALAASSPRVDDAMASATMRTKFAFRRRASRFVLDELYSDEESDDEFAAYEGGIPPPSAFAAAHAGVDHVRISFLEARAFGDRAKGAAGEGAYLGMRNALLERWAIEGGCGVEVDERDAVEKLGARTEEEVAYASRCFRWLEENGGINYGIAVPAPTRGSKAEETGAREDGDARDGDAPTESRVTRELVVVLRGADLTVDTEKAIRQRLEERMGMSLKEFKPVIRETIEKFLANPAAFEDGGAGVGSDDSAVTMAEIPPRPAFTDARPTIVIGAGPAGLAAATMIRRQGGEVVVLEARDRVGGRVHTDWDTFSAPVDLGASIVTGISEDPKRRTGMPWLGVRADPSGIIAKQLGLNLVELREGCPLYDTKDGGKVSAEMDEKVERIRDLVMDEARAKVDASGESETVQSSLGDAIKTATENYFLKLVQDDGNDSDDSETHAAVRAEQASRMGKTERRLLDWHWANLEYGCSASLNDVSLPHWNQDEVFGGFGGAHCMVGGGYGQITARLAEGLDIRLSTPVADVRHDADGVVVETKDGEKIEGASVIVTVPLGCLKAGDVTFSPPLGEMKSSAVQRLGFGNLNKVVLEFDEAFWDQSIDYFGSAIDSEENRGRSFMFWNLVPVSGKPMLISLIAGDAAKFAENEGSESIVASVLATLARICFPDDPSKMPPLKQSLVTRWQSDPYARGSYSFVAVGSKGAADYDDLGKPEGRVLFAGEHTCREHPDTVGGAMLTGWRAARQALAISRGQEVFDEVFNLDEMRGAIARRENDGEYQVDGDDAVERIIDPSEMYRRRMQEDLLADTGKEEAKITYRIVSAVEAGEKVDVPVEFATIMLKLRTVPGRRAMINALLDDVSARDRREWALKNEGLTLLNEWLNESKSHTKSSESLLLTMRMLELLLAIPTDLPALRASGIPRTLKNRFQTHENGRLRVLARQCGHRWMQALSRKSAGLPPIDDAEEEPVKKPPPRKKTAGLGVAVLLGGASANAVVDEPEDVDVEIKKDDLKIEPVKTAEEIRAKRDAIISAAQDLPEGQAALAAREAADRAAAQVEEAMRLAEEAQHAAREAETVATFGLRMSKKDVISSFDAFSDAANKKRERAKSKKRKASAEDEDEDEDDDAPGVSLDEYHARVRKQVRHYVHEQLQDKRDRGIVTKAECKKLEEKVVDKILEGSKGVDDVRKAFMTSKRKEKIKSLVSAYCQSTVKARKKSKH